MHKKITLIISLLTLTLTTLFNSQTAEAQCAGIDFSSDTTKICSPGVVKFFALGAPAGSVYFWDFGSGMVAGKDTTNKLYSTGGLFDVTLMTISPLGDTCLVFKSQYIESGLPPVPSVFVSRNNLCNGTDTVTFFTSSAFQQVDWIIEGNTFYNAGPNKVHTFASAGYKTVTIRVLDSLGCSGIRKFDSIVHISDPVSVNFAADTTNGCNPLTINYTSSLVTNGQTVTSYAWSFPGGTPSTSSQPNPSGIVYSTQGIYDVTLDITTAAGCFYTLTKTNHIKLGDNVAVTFTSDMTVACHNQLVTYTNTTGAGLPGSFAWNLPGATIISQNQTQSQVQYSVPGQYDAQLTYSYNGCVTTNIKPAYITVIFPVADFTSLEATNCFAPDTVQFFDNTAVPASGSILSYLWTFYDTDGVSVLGTSVLKDPSFIYPTLGNRHVQLRVTHSNGCVDVLRKNNFVRLNAPVASFQPNLTTTCPGAFVTFRSTSGTISSAAPNQYQWTFYDLDSVTVLGTSNTDPAYFAYANPGSYNVRFRIFNSYGCNDDTLMKQVVTVNNVVADFNVTDSVLCEGETFFFSTNNTPASVTVTHRYELQHKDSANIKHVYYVGNFSTSIPVAGVYHVKYVASAGPGGCTDSIIKNNYMLVNGISGDFTVGTKRGCKPLTTILNSSLNYNIHPSAPGNFAISYQWSATPATGVNFSSPTSAITNVTFSQAGIYSIRLIMTNGTSCADTITKDFLDTIGVVADFALPFFDCYKAPVVAQNLSIINPVAYQWSAGPGVTFSPYDTSTSPALIFADSGSYAIKMVVINDIGCKDSITKNIYIERPIFDFITTDTLNNCAPALVKFVIKPFNTTSYRITFGDGDTITTTDTVVYHYYQFNTGGSGSGYNICVTGMTFNNCPDTLCKSKYVKVIGPAPGFSMFNNKGCGPITTTFTNSNVNVSDFYFDYGDGSTIQQNAIPPHVYNVIGNVPYSVYKPYMLAFDDALCNTTYYPLDSVVVYNVPKNIGFSTDTSVGCAPLIVTFTDTTQSSVFRIWDFENDGIPDDTSSVSRITTHSYPTGNYVVKLYVVNMFGCLDSITDSLRISARPSPQAEFDADDSIICYNSLVNFTDITTSVDSVISWEWNFGETGTTTDTSTLQNPSYTYTEMGLHNVSLIVTSIFGCKDTINKNDIIFVEDTLPPVNTGIKYVTVVLNSNNIKIEWDRSNINDFFAYVLERNDPGNPQNIYNGFLITDTVFNDIGGVIDVQNSSYNYNLRVQDRCGNISAPSIEHRTILLKATTNNSISNLLTWTHYVGWPSIATYNIYKTNGVGNFTQIATVPGTDSTYIDDNLCDSNYCYYVVAVHPNGLYFSESNHSCNNPPYIYPVLPISITHTTVRENLYIETTWDTSALPGKKQYIVDKFHPVTGWTNGIFITKGSIYVDTKVLVNQFSYQYRVNMQDNCGNITPLGNVGTSIHLRGSLYAELPVLRWNTYSYWPNGVNQYLVQLRENDQVFRTVATVSGTDTQYIDLQKHAVQLNPYCYRIIAIENSPVPDSSISNYSCLVIPSHMYIPNAFTPNKDLLNDTFYVNSLAIFNSGTGIRGTDFELLITDRWGQIVFRTSDINDGWDGTKDGVPLPVGVYSYLVRALGMDNVRYNVKGIVHLMR